MNTTLMKTSLNVLVLCHGNINRSPLCCALLNHFGIPATSAGFAANGGPIAKRIRDYLRELTIPVIPERSTGLSIRHIVKADMIIYMDGGNKKRLDELCKKEDVVPPPTFCLGEFSAPPVSRIPDPAFMARGTPEEKATLDLIFVSTWHLAKRVLRPFPLSTSADSVKRSCPDPT